MTAGQKRSLFSHALQTLALMSPFQCCVGKAGGRMLKGNLMYSECLMMSFSTEWMTYQICHLSVVTLPSAGALNSIPRIYHIRTLLIPTPFPISPSNYKTSQSCSSS